MPNVVAYAMIVLWPIAAFLLVRNKPAPVAAMLLFVVPFLILPERTGFDPPIIPPINKASIAALVAALIFYLKYREYRIFPDNMSGRFFIFLLFVIPIFTILTNGDTLVYGSRVLPSLRVIDYFSMTFTLVTTYQIPFIIGFYALNTPNAHRVILYSLVVAGIVYSVPMLWEVRMSPQLHSQIYGFFQHSFAQVMRGDGFRPVVFLENGLEASLFIALSLISAATLWKRSKGGWVVTWGIPVILGLAAVVVLSKTVSALMYSVLGVGAVLVLSYRNQIKVALLIAILITIFPLFRGNDLVPTEALTAYAAKHINQERADSLSYRFKNEDILLEKASEKSLFGWGAWGRSRVYDYFSGRDLSTTDGFWVIAFGKYGWFGYFVIFGLLVYPIYATQKSFRYLTPEQASPFTPALCVILAVNLIDLIPNSSNNQMVFLIAGALLGKVSKDLMDRKQQRAEELGNLSRTPVSG